MKTLTENLALALLAGAFSLANTAQAAYISADFNWVGDSGYIAEGTFTFDDTFALIDAEGGDLGNFNNGQLRRST